MLQQYPPIRKGSPKINSTNAILLGRCRVFPTTTVTTPHKIIVLYELISICCTRRKQMSSSPKTPPAFCFWFYLSSFISVAVLAAPAHISFIASRDLFFSARAAPTSLRTSWRAAWQSKPRKGVRKGMRGRDGKRQTEGRNR